MDAMLFELAALGVDIVLFGVFYSLYKNKSRNVASLKETPLLNIDSDLYNKVKQAGNAIPYAAVAGNVWALGAPLRSQYTSNLKGVIREKITKEQKVRWSPMLRLWSTVEHDIQRTHNSVPFALYGNRGIFKTGVEILDPLSAEELNLPRIYEEFFQHQDTIGEAVVGWFRGERTTGIQEIENMLTEGSLLTGIGELVFENDKLKMRAPRKGLTYYLTSLSLDSLIKKINEEAKLFKILTIIMGGLGIFLISYVSKKGWSSLQKKLSLARQRKLIEEARQKRRMEDPHRVSDTTETIRVPLCVVCLTNPVEILILECGHTCLCIDCSQHVQEFCPVCRAEIQRIVPAYLP